MELAVAMGIVVVLAAVAVPVLRQVGNRTLYNTSLQLQADIRYAQQRAIREGRPIGIHFERATGRYRIVYFTDVNTPPTANANTRDLRVVHLPSGVYFDYITTGINRIWFHPRGTPSHAFRVRLRQGGRISAVRQDTTVTVSGGRAFIWPINQPAPRNIYEPQ
ncbi:MAG: GspH/FimT family protein [Defluviitaleaceae bacterium]|nr:GspH/FimT family protein [Defluviitaleaceae bacterium]